jgi:hypothetical protein
MTKNKKQNREQKKEKKNHTWKKNEVCLLFLFTVYNLMSVWDQRVQTSNLYLIKQKYKSFLLIIFIIKHIRKTRIFLKKKKEKNKINKRIK